MPSTITKAVESGQYPQWLVDVVKETNETAKVVANHEAWQRFSDGTIPEKQHHALLTGFWPLIERFPQYLALNLLKCSYGSDAPLKQARGWLIKNLRIEQRHAEMYRDWAVAAGVPEHALFHCSRPAAATAITDWCWHVCEADGLAEGMAATNFAIEGVTGEWTQMVWESPDYKLFFPEPQRKKAMRWIQAHAAYDDAHPVEALDIIYALLGDQPDTRSVYRVQRAIQKSYDLYRLALDVGMGMA